MPESYASSEAEEGSGAGSDDESGMSCRGSLSDPRWSRMTGGTKGWRLRGVEWRVKLGILPGNNASVDAMRRATADGRRKYADLRRRLLVDPHIMDEEQTASPLRMDNPLSQDPESVWGRYFRNAELEKTIDKDLTRLYPEHGVFFQSAPCQAMMRRILLVWSLIHPHFSYRQGMHELLAPLLYVLHVDVVRLSQVKHRFEDLFDDRFDSLSLQEQHVRDKVESAKNFCGEMIVAGDSINFKGRAAETTGDRAVDPEEQRVDLSVIIQGSDMYGVEGELGALLSARFLEHDAYCMLDALLDGQGGAVAMAEYFQSSSGGGKPPVIEASAAIYRTLAAADISLYTHLVELGVEPQFFALRWLRLLFGREFVLEDLLRVWDAMFEADNTPLYQHGGEDDVEMKVSQRGALISSFSVSMLLYVRPALLAAPDVTACLQRLLYLPQVPDVRDLIEGAKALQLLAQAAVKSPGKPLPRNIRTTDNKTNGKHVRSGSSSPPNPQRHVGRPQMSAPSSPDILKVSMSLPGSYWEEKWTFSVLQNKSPDELFSPKIGRTEPLARDLDHADKDGSNTAGTLSRSASGHNRPDQVVPSLSVRSYDSSPESSDDDGQEMLRRGGESSSSKDSILNGISSSIGLDKSRRAAGDKKPNSQQDASLASTTSASALEQGRPSTSGSPRKSSAVKTGSSAPISSEALESAMFGDDGLGSTDVVDKFEVTKSITADLGNERDLTLEGTGPVRAVPPGSSSEAQDFSQSGMASMQYNAVIASAPLSPTDTESSESSAVVERGAALHSESATIVQPEVDIPSPTVSSEAPEVKEMSQDKGGNGDSVIGSRGVESKGDHGGVEDGISRTAQMRLPSKSKPPLPPSRLGRFNWVWSLGRSSFGAQTATPKVSKDDSPGNEATPNPSGTTASDSDVSNSAAANAAQRRKKSWWRANSDVVPEECVATTSADSGHAVDASSDAHESSDSVKSGTESPAVASGAQVKYGSVEEIPAPTQGTTKQPQGMTPCGESQPQGQRDSAIQPDDTTPCAAAAEPGQDAAEKPKDIIPSAMGALQAVGQETAKKPKDMTPSAALQALGQDSAKKTKDITPSAALHALGQAVLEHVQVLESALAQKVTVLSIENMIRTPAARERSEDINKTCLGSKGQGAGLAAIAELRKISLALQQM